MNALSYIQRLFLLAAISCLVVSCGSPAKSYYRLSSDGPAPDKSGKTVGFGPVTVAAYLERPNIVFEEGPNRMAVSESHRWAGDLADNISRVTAANLGRQLGTGNIRIYPWGADKGLDYQITVDIHEFHGNAAGDAILSATWRAYALPAGTQIKSKSFAATEPLKADGYDELIAAQSRLLSALAADIAGGLK